MEAISMRKETPKLTGAWVDTFGEPEWIGVWSIWGSSGDGKGSFVMQLRKELARFGRVAYDSLKEGASLTMQNTLRRFSMAEVNRRSQLLGYKPMSEFGKKMDKHKNLNFYVIDSFQYAQMSYKGYIKFKEAYRNRLLISTSHADSRNSDGRSAKKVVYGTTLKIYVERPRVSPRGYFFGSVGHSIIWNEGAVRYWEGNA